MARFLRLLWVSLLFVDIAHACNFRTEQASLPRYYRDDGWVLPEVELWKFSAPATFSGPGSLEATLGFGPSIVPGLISRIKVGGATQSEPYVFEIPSQNFEQDGKRRVMSYQTVGIRGSVWRYDLDDKVVAYTIGFAPVEARRVNGHWKVQGEVAYIFYGTFIDNRGDGVFRLLVPGWMKPDLIPQWALKRDPA